MSFLDKLMHAADMHQKGDPALGDDHSVYASPGDPEQQFDEKKNPNQAELANDPAKGTVYKGTQQIPYRGAEQHGVAYVSDNRYDNHHSTSGHLIDDTATVHVDWSSEEEVHPVPVRIVDTAPSRTERRMLAFSTTTLIAGDTNNQMQRILMQRPNRTKADIKILSAGPAFTVPPRAWITTDQPSLPFPINGIPNGFPIDNSSNSYSTTTTEELWVAFDVGAAGGSLAIIAVAEEYTVETPARGEKPEKASLVR